MEILINKINEFSNYLLNNSLTEEGKENINGAIINAPNFVKINSIKFYRPEDENENKSVIESDENKNEKIVHRYSQVNEWINIFGLKKDDEEVKNKLNEYLNVFLTYKKELNL